MQTHDLACLKLACVLCDWISHIFFPHLCWLSLVHQPNTTNLYSPIQPFLPYSVETSVPASAQPMMPDFVNHLLHLKVSVLLLHVMLLLLLGEKLCASCPEGKLSTTSSFLYHRACKIVNVIRQARPETMDCHAAQYYLLAPLCSSLCLFPPFVSSYMLAVGCFPAGFVEPLAPGEH